ncbi:unnamed protein product [Clonostachys solani]|uniref:DUF6536 domain-containing protein n=1 Tax=Clonostachys solani TaxID=160281 RepID=A0A9N9WBR0_9HYPO|nr:unnamed protein product [Clonostachys solani]
MTFVGNQRPSKGPVTILGLHRVKTMSRPEPSGLRNSHGMFNMSNLSLDNLNQDGSRAVEGSANDDSCNLLSPLVPIGLIPFSSRPKENNSNSFGQALNRCLGFMSASQGMPHKPTGRPCFQGSAGWQRGASWAAVLISVILLGNIILTVVCKSNFHPTGAYTNIVTIRAGDCKEMKNLGVIIHLVINIISTLLVGASNYCMQTVSAPTREDIDKVHARGSWLDIGIPSVRNMWFIRKRRLVVWLVLGITSIPLHLVYNSIFFVSTNTYLYDVWFAEESFLHGAAFGDIYFPGRRTPMNKTAIEGLQDRVMNGDRYERLSNNDCIKEYAKDTVESRGDVILVVDPPENCLTLQYNDAISDAASVHYYNPECGNITSTSLYAIETSTQNFQSSAGDYRTNRHYWICSQYAYYPMNDTDILSELCSHGAWKKQLDADPWMVKGAKVNYCLSDKLPDKCRFKVAINLLYVVIAFNVAKIAIVDILIATKLINDDPIVTIGDAVASFIESPDPSTTGMCLWPAKNIKFHKSSGELPAIIHQSTSNRWFHAVSVRRWVISSLIVFITMAALFGLFGWSVANLKKLYFMGELSYLWSIGVGKITPYNFITGWRIPKEGDSAIAAVVLISNLPQVLFSFIYVVLNGLITSMTAAAEWSSYAVNTHRPLRVSFPKASQRTTFFLQMPYRYSIPIIILSILMHWLISQSFFMVQIAEISTTYEEVEPLNFDKIDAGTAIYGNLITTVAFSPMGILFTALLLAVVFLGALGLGMIRLKGEIPVAGSCSLAIAAACHAPEGTSSLKPLKWGEVLSTEAGDDGVGHCAFSNDFTQIPELGNRYA